MAWESRSECRCRFWGDKRNSLDLKVKSLLGKALCRVAAIVATCIMQTSGYAKKKPQIRATRLRNMGEVQQQKEEEGIGVAGETTYPTTENV